MIESHLIERIEGEATLEFKQNESAITFAAVRFEQMRGMESLMQGKKALDALIYTPRVCGICGHAHLGATVRALEAAYADAGVGVIPTPKALAIRELTHTLELIQNHIKWFYLVILPELYALGGECAPRATVLKGAYGAQAANRALALFGGQWPHSSYMVPGGVTCDPTPFELLKAEAALDESCRFFEKEVAGISLEALQEMLTCKEFNGLESDLGAVESRLMALGLHEKGLAHDRFLVLGEHGFATRSRMMATKSYKAESEQVDTCAASTLQGVSKARNARLGGIYYETGPLARAMGNDVALIKNMHRRFKDSAYTRVMARVMECAQLLRYARTLLRKIDLSEPSCVSLPPIESISGFGEGIVEAPRGPLVHRVTLQSGVIAAYEIITPTQWNLASGSRDQMGPAQQAMIGASSLKEAEFIFRTFDVCSVCTTH